MKRDALESRAALPTTSHVPELPPECQPMLELDVCLMVAWNAAGRDAVLAAAWPRRRHRATRMACKKS